MLAVTYKGELEYNNTKGIVFRLTPKATYGVNGVGDIVDLRPSNVADPNLAYNAILDQAPSIMGILNANLGGSYCNLLPNAVPTLANLGLQMYEPGGAEKATNAAYTAAELAGYIDIIVAIPALQ